MTSAAEGLEEVIVSISARNNTIESVLAIQKKSASLLDGLSSQSFKNIGASDMASAIKQVPGVSVLGGKYVYVRGLGDRYTKTKLNSLDLPGLDPDRNSIQIGSSLDIASSKLRKVKVDGKYISPLGLTEYLGIISLQIITY